MYLYVITIFNLISCTKMDKISVGSTTSPENVVSSTNSIFNTIRSKVFSTLFAPPNFVQTPPSLPGTTLSNPPPMSTPMTTEEVETGFVDDITILDEKISNLEEQVQEIVNPSTPATDTETSISPVVFFDDGDCVLPPLHLMRDKMPPSVFRELINIYEGQVLYLGNNVVPEQPINNQTQTPNGTEENPNYANQAPNLRSQVLKWNRD